MNGTWFPTFLLARLVGSAVQGQAMANTSNGGIVLCVDDEALGLSVRKLLLEFKGYRVFTAENGPDALALFAAEPIDLVVLDFKMPGMNGDVVAERMKRLKPAVPILMLSAYVDLPRETLALVDKYVTKGEPPQVLLGFVAELLNAKQKVHSKATTAE
jgi:CheY-like chemotaxis protein